MNFEEFKDKIADDVKKTMKSVLISSAARPTPFGIQELRDITMYDELAVMDGGKCILQLRGVRPFLSDKYDVTQHPHYKETGEYDKKNNYDIEGNLNPRMSLKEEDLYDVVEA